MGFRLRSNTHWNSTKLHRIKLHFTWINCIFENKKRIFFYFLKNKHVPIERPESVIEIEYNQTRQILELSYYLQRLVFHLLQISHLAPVSAACVSAKTSFFLFLWTHQLYYLFFTILFFKLKANKNETFSISGKPDGEFTFIIIIII